MRPQNLEDFAGQDLILSKGKPLRQWIENDRIPSLILWGPPGCGKTTLAKIMAQQTLAHFESLSAVLSGIKGIKEAVDRARNAQMSGRKTLLFVDEIHRFNKSQQDALLPHVEDGTVTLVGATTENPSFELNRALLSRCRVIRFQELNTQAIRQILERALRDPEKGLGSRLELDEEALEWLSETAEGDARKALTTLENISLNLSGRVGLEQAQKALEAAMDRQPIPYDKGGEEHYNVISAFIKSIRDSDPHAGLYYLARMIEGGEDPLFIARRLVILASEDIGNADPRALQIALAVKDAVHFVGLPEARINLAQGVTYLASAPKSNASYQGINEAMAEVKKTGALPIPLHLRNAVTGLLKKEGYGQGYQYAHNERSGKVKQKHLPDRLIGTRYYRPTENGLEKQIKSSLDLRNELFE